MAIESIAVLPFENTAHDPNADYLTDGLTESIINSLTQLPNLKVIARSSVFRYKGKVTDPVTAGKDVARRETGLDGLRAGPRRDVLFFLVKSQQRLDLVAEIDVLTARGFEEGVAIGVRLA